MATISGIVLSNTKISADCPVGTEVGTIAVTMSDGSKFDGTLTLSGPFISAFSISSVRDPYWIASLGLSGSLVVTGQPVGTKLGTIAVAMSDASPFSGQLSVDDTAHFAISGTDLVTSSVLTTAGNLSVTITAAQTGCANYSQAFPITVQQGQLPVPGAPTGLTVVSKSTSTVTLSFGPPTSGAALDAGKYQLEYKAHSSGIWLNGPSIQYCTQGHGSFTDGYGNVWSIAASNSPVVNGFTDPYSHATLMLLVGGTIWQYDVGGNWWGTTPTGTVASASLAWSSGGTISPLTSITISGLTAATLYDFDVWVSNSGGNGPPSVTVQQITDTPSESGTGPGASSSFITADFASVFNYPNGTGQQIVSPYAYGSHSSSWTDFIGTSEDWWANNQVLTQYGQINPGIQLIKAPGRMWNYDLSLNTSAIAAMLNNVYKIFPTGVGGMVYLPPGMQAGTSPNGRVLSVQEYSDMVYQTANYMFNYTMPNGKKFPLIGIGGEDECGQSEDFMVPYYNSFAPRVKSISNNLLIFGPTLPSPAYWDFGSRVPLLDVYGCNAFVNVHGTADDMSALNGWIADIPWQDATGSNIKYSGYTSGGSDWDCWGPQLFSYPEAMLHCKCMVNSLNDAKYQFIGCFWGGLADCGLMDFPVSGGHWQGTGLTYPIGFWFAQGVRNLTGPRWQVPTNSTGMSTVAVTPATGRFGLLIFNVGSGTRSGQVALSHWPVNTSGNATASVWQMTSAQNGKGKDGTHTTVRVGTPNAPGVTDTMTFPDPSITIISI